MTANTSTVSQERFVFLLINHRYSIKTIHSNFKISYPQIGHKFTYPSSSFRKLKLYSKSNAASSFSIYIQGESRGVKMAGKNWMWSVRFIIKPRFRNAILVLLNVTAQNSIRQGFSLHATINRLHPNSTAPSIVGIGDESGHTVYSKHTILRSPRMAGHSLSLV